MEKHGTDREVTDENIMWCMRFMYGITEAMDTHSEYVILLLHSKKNYTNATHRQFVRLLYYNCLRLHVVITQLVRNRGEF